jgi:hypothetical protein
MTRCPTKRPADFEARMRAPTVVHSPCRLPRVSLVLRPDGRGFSRGWDLSDRELRREISFSASLASIAR